MQALEIVCCKSKVLRTVSTYSVLTVLRTSDLQQTISRACINKNKHSFTSARVFRIPNSTDTFEVPCKIVPLSKFSNKQLSKSLLVY